MQTTIWFTLAVLQIVIAYDVFVAATQGSEFTISWTCLLLSMQHPILPFAVGVLCGHLFWPQVAQRLNG